MMGLGWQEIAFIVILLFLLLGPEEGVKTARLLGRLLRKLYLSTFWRVIARMRYEFEQYIREEIRKAGLEELERIQQETGRIWPPEAATWEGRLPMGPPPQAVTVEGSRPPSPPDEPAGTEPPERE